MRQLQCLVQEPEAAAAPVESSSQRSSSRQNTDSLFDNLKLFTTNEPQRLTKEEADKVWEERRRKFESNNEKKARQISLQWQREKKSLEKVHLLASIYIQLYRRILITNISDY